MQYTEDLLHQRINGCVKCGGQGCHPSQDGATVTDCVCAKRLRLFLAVGIAIYNHQPPVEDDRLQPDQRLLIRASWEWLAPRILGMACSRFTRIAVVTDVDIRDGHFGWKSDPSATKVRDMMGDRRLVVVRLGVAAKTKGLDEIVGEALHYRESAPVWVMCPHGYHSATPKLFEAMQGFVAVDSEASNGS